MAGVRSKMYATDVEGDGHRGKKLAVIKPKVLGSVWSIVETSRITRLNYSRKRKQ